MPNQTTPTGPETSARCKGEVLTAYRRIAQGLIIVSRYAVDALHYVRYDCCGRDIPLKENFVP